MQQQTSRDPVTGRYQFKYEDKMLRMSSQPQQKTPRRPQQRGRQNLFDIRYQQAMEEKRQARERQERIDLERAVKRLKWQADELEAECLEREEERKRQEQQRKRDLPSTLAHLETLVAEYEASNEGKAAQSVYDHQQLIKKYNSFDYRQEIAAQQAQAQAERRRWN